MKELSITLIEEVAAAVMVTLAERICLLEFRLNNAGEIPKVFREQIQGEKSLLVNGFNQMSKALDREKRIISLN